jgi:hypothetical protein
MSGPIRRSEHTGPTEHEHSYPGTSDAAAPGHGGKTRLSIWFFVGALSLMYGLVLLPLGVYQFNHPPKVVLSELHATFWWGILMTIFGGFYTLRFRPRSS